MTNAPTKCASCAREFDGTPFMVGRRLACCTNACADKLARLEVVRLEEWLALIKKKTRGAANDLAGIALYSNQVAWRKVKP